MSVCMPENAAWVCDGNVDTLHTLPERANWHQAWMMFIFNG